MNFHLRAPPKNYFNDILMKNSAIFELKFEDDIRKRRHTTSP